MSTDQLINGIYPQEYFVLAGVDQIQYPTQYWWESKERYAAVNPNNPSNYLSIANGGQQTYEYLEIDLGRVRQCNYLNMQILKTPLEVLIEYDAVSDDDANHTWVPVTEVPDEPFADRIHYDATSRAAWENAEFFFTDQYGQMINARFFRIRFKRRDVEWPYKGAKPFRWPVMVKNYRSGRIVSEYIDTQGPLWDAGDDSTSTTLMGFDQITFDFPGTTTSGWIKQQFGMPADALRGNINPNILGFSVLVYVEPNSVTNEFIASEGGHPNEGEVVIQWQIYDVTDRADGTVIKSGINRGALNDGSTWINVYFDPQEPIATDSDNPKIYELRFRSQSVNVPLNFTFTDEFGNLSTYDQTRQIWGKVIDQVAHVPGMSVPGLGAVTNGASTITFANEDVTADIQPGDYIQRIDLLDDPQLVDSVSYSSSNTHVSLDQPYTGETVAATTFMIAPYYTVDDETPSLTRSLCMRLWGDVSDVGRDVLGNYYRYGTRIDSAEKVQDDQQVGWMSEPQPSPNAVEALYFDVRDANQNPSVIDAIRIAARTPNVNMHVYWTTDSLRNGHTPATRHQWDYMRWNPIHATYVLQGNQTITFPTTIRAGYIKLEFTKLQPRPYDIPSRPTPPFKQFNRYPSWIELQFENSTVKRTVEDWFNTAAKNGRVSIDVLKFISNPVLEFQYKERAFLAALATGHPEIAAANAQNNASLINTKTNEFIDPVTSSQININTNRMFQTPLTLTVDKNSVLGSVVASQTNTGTFGASREGNFNITQDFAQNVSSGNDRVSESFSHIAQTPMWFNRTCRHIYAIDKARFNKQAYFVGITSVEFMRIDNTVARDQDTIVENFYDNQMIDTNSWITDDPSRILGLIGPGHDNSLNALIQPIQFLVSYTVDDISVTDEVIGFTYSTQIAQLAISGSTQGINFQMYLDQNGQRGTQYFLGRDFDVSFDTDSNTGEIVNQITLQVPSNRLVVEHIDTNFDSATVVGRGVIGSTDTKGRWVATGAPVGGVG